MSKPDKGFEPVTTEVATLGNGCHLFRSTNEVGGYTYTSDEIGAGVMVWDTALVGVETILTAIADYKKLQAQELDMGYDDGQMIEPSNSERAEWPEATRTYVEDLETLCTGLEHTHCEVCDCAILTNSNGECMQCKIKSLEYTADHCELYENEICFLKQSLDTAKFQARDRRAEIARLTQWVADLQSGQFTTCIYCGHRYGPTTEVAASKAEILKEHIQHCSMHPMSKLQNKLEAQNKLLEQARQALIILRPSLDKKIRLDEKLGAILDKLHLWREEERNGPM